MSAPAAKPAPAPIDIDATRVAALLSLPVEEFRTLMAAGKIATLCERGTGSDEGRWRATFWHGRARARLVVDAEGRIIATA